MKSHRAMIAISICLLTCTTLWGKSGILFNGIDAKGAEINCECFSIILDGFKFFTSSLFLKFEIRNVGTEQCEVDPYQFRIIDARGKQLDVSEALTEQDLLAPRLGRQSQKVTLLPKAAKTYWLQFAETLRLNKAKPTAFFYKDKQLGNFTLR